MLRRYVFFCPSPSRPCDLAPALAAIASVGARAAATGADKVVVDLHGEQLEVLVSRLPGWDYLPDRRRQGRAAGDRVMPRGAALVAGPARPL